MMNLFLLVLIGVGGTCVRGAAMEDTVPHHGCEYQGQMHVAGSKWRPDACTACHCHRRGGEARCIVEDCLKQDDCLTYGNSSKVCCPTCEEYGCLHTDGQLYRPGDIIKEAPCVRCLCPVGGGPPVCDVTSCPSSECVDPVVIPGVCCPSCPNGPNCQIGLLTLPIGQSVTIEGALCTCEKFVDGDGQIQTLARCNKN